MMTKDDGICIRCTDYSETSQILVFFTKQNGKLSVIAKGSRREKSQFAGAVEIGTAGTMLFTLKQNSSLGTLTEFAPYFVLAKIRKKLLPLNCVIFTAEVLNLSTTEFDPHPELFVKTEQFFKNIEQSENKKVPEKLLDFEFALLKEIGSKPLAYECANCSRKFADDWGLYFFSNSASGLICRDCETAFTDKIQIDYKTASVLSDNSDIKEADYKTQLKIQKIITGFLTYTLARPIKSAAMLYKIMETIR